MQVDVSAEEEKFQEVVTAGLTVLILGIETSLDRALQEMVRMPWATIESVGACAALVCRDSCMCSVLASAYIMLQVDGMQYHAWSSVPAMNEGGG